MNPVSSPPAWLAARPVEEWSRDLTPDTLQVTRGHDSALSPSGPKRLYEREDRSGVNAAHVTRLERILTLLDVAQRPADIDLPGYRLHPLKGERKGEWSVSVSGNWRVTFRFDEGDVTDLNYEDYH
mgnify:CR=1 FL=1